MFRWDHILTINSLYQLSKSVDLHLNSWLCKGVVVLYARQGVKELKNNADGDDESVNGGLDVDGQS